MHSDSAIRTVGWLGRGGLVAIALGGVAAVAGTIPVATPLVADLVLATVGAGAFATAGWGWSVLSYLKRLPLELGATIARSKVDGALQYRVRARLGRGRVLRDAQATASWNDASGQSTPLDTWTPPLTIVGPFSVVLRDPTGAIEGEGSVHVEVRGRSRGREWSAQRNYPVQSIRSGVFGGVSVDAKGLSLLDDQWADVQE